MVVSSFPAAYWCLAGFSCFDAALCVVCCLTCCRGGFGGAWLPVCCGCYCWDCCFVWVIRCWCLLSWWFAFCLLCRFGYLLVVGCFDLFVLYWCCWF